MRLTVRKGTTAQWTARNPILAAGEFGFDTTTKTLKIGDGVTAWGSLASVGGGSGTDYKTGAVPLSGQWSRTPEFGPVGSNLTMTGDRLYLTPFRLAAATTFTLMGIDVVTAAAAGGVIRLGIWAADAAGARPGTLVLDASTTAADTTGGKVTGAFSQALTAGVYWRGACSQVATGAVVRGSVSGDPLVSYFTGANMFTGSVGAAALYANGITGAFASNPVIVDNDTAPIIGMRAA